jgi:hypothetical protein
LSKHWPPGQIAVSQEEGCLDQRRALVLRNRTAQDLSFEYLIDHSLGKSKDLGQALGERDFDAHAGSLKRSFTPGSPPLVNSMPAARNAASSAWIVAIFVDSKGPSSFSSRFTVSTETSAIAATVACSQWQEQILRVHAALNLDAQQAAYDESMAARATVL